MLNLKLKSSVGLVLVATLLTGSCQSISNRSWQSNMFPSLSQKEGTEGNCTQRPSTPMMSNQLWSHSIHQVSEGKLDGLQNQINDLVNLVVLLSKTCQDLRLRIEAQNLVQTYKDCSSRESLKRMEEQVESLKERLRKMDRNKVQTHIKKQKLVHPIVTNRTPKDLQGMIIKQGNQNKLGPTKPPMRQNPYQKAFFITRKSKQPSPDQLVSTQSNELIEHKKNKRKRRKRKNKNSKRNCIQSLSDRGKENNAPPNISLDFQEEVTKVNIKSTVSPKKKLLEKKPKEAEKPTNANQSTSSKKVPKVLKPKSSKLKNKAKEGSKRRKPRSNRSHQHRKRKQKLKGELKQKKRKSKNNKQKKRKTNAKNRGGRSSKHPKKNTSKPKSKNQPLRSSENKSKVPFVINLSTPDLKEYAQSLNQSVFEKLQTEFRESCERTGIQGTCSIYGGRMLNLMKATNEEVETSFQEFEVLFCLVLDCILVNKFEFNYQVRLLLENMLKNSGNPKPGKRKDMLRRYYLCLKQKS